MRWTITFVGTVLSMSLLACSTGHRGTEVYVPGDSSTPPGDVISAQPAHCDGICVVTAPATYTGPSLFWIGAAKLAPGCPPESPYPGIEGYVTEQKGALFARECRITPSDLCPAEGQTCAPLPPEEFHVCIHHDDESPCPLDYPERSTMGEIESQMTITLCCQKSPVAS